MSKYVIIEAVDVNPNVFDAEAFISAELMPKVFDDLKSLRKYLKADTLHHARNYKGRLTHPETWASKALICEVIDIVNPIPDRQNNKVKLVKVKVGDLRKGKKHVNNKVNSRRKKVSD